MGAKKNRDKEILDHKAKKNKELAKAWKKYNVNQQKIDKIEAKQLRYEEWLAEVEAGPDY